MMHGFWIIALVMAGLTGLAAWRPDIGSPVMRSLAIRYSRSEDPAQVRRNPLPMRTLFVCLSGACLGASAITFARPDTPGVGVGLAAYVAGLATLALWTARVLAPKRQGVSPWPLMIKAFPIVAMVYGALFGVTAMLERNPVLPWLAGGALTGSFIGACAAAAAWAKTFGVQKKRAKSAAR